MQWFIDAAQALRGMSIKVVSETITTHEYEAKVLAPAFTAITGIKVTHDLIGEGDVVEKLQTQMQTGENIYDAYINDSDLIGTHWRYQQARNLTDWMAGEGAAVTNPNLDLADFIGTVKFTTGPDGKLYQLPDQQFANLYWFRYDWFNDEKTKADFKAKYGYDLGVPVNWSAYEDIAEFFTGRDMSTWADRQPRSMATWTTARRTPRSAGATPTRGCRWPAWATWASRTACRSTNGASGWTRTAVPSAPAWRAAVRPTTRRRSMP
jgi:glycerol transport system substrate-binding protein